jgi:hypothetical protein
MVANYIVSFAKHFFGDTFVQQGKAALMIHGIAAWSFSGLLAFYWIIDSIHPRIQPSTQRF